MTIEAVNVKFGMFGYLDMHTAVRRHIDNLLVKIYVTLPSDRTAVQKIQNEFNFYWEMVEHHHKTEDEGFFPMLAGLDTIFATHFANMTADHEEIDEIVANIQAALEGSVGSYEGAYDQLKAQVRKFRDTMFEHLAAEEAVVVPAINRNFSYEQQLGLEGQVLASMDVNHLAKMYPWMYILSTEEERNNSIPQLPKAHYQAYAGWEAEYKRTYSFN